MRNLYLPKPNPWPESIKPGGVRHALALIAAGFIVDGSDSRWPRRTLDALIDRARLETEGYWFEPAVNWHTRFERGRPLDPIDWFDGAGHDDAETLALEALRHCGLL